MGAGRAEERRYHPPTWTADGGGFSGSGTYATTPDVFNSLFQLGTPITISLTGTPKPG